MWIFFKSQISSLIATGVDFLITILLVETLHAHYIAATVAGAATGALTNFGINKYWSFESGKENFMRQGLRYGLVWIGSLLLNTSGLYLLLLLPGSNYIVSKIITAITVGIGFNYSLQKYYVFQPHEKVLRK